MKRKSVNRKYSILNGIKTRGTAIQIATKYKQLALEVNNFDRESFLQQAEHWTRVAAPEG